MKYFYTFIFLCASFLTIAQPTPGSGNMLDFNGSSSFIDCDSVTLSGASITLSAWIKVDAFKSSFPFITSVIGTEVNSSNTALIRIGDANIPNNKIQFVISTGSSHIKLESVTNLSTNKWYHLAATYDGTMMRLYINGDLDASSAASGNVASDGLFAIGRNYGNDRIIDGKIDEARAWTTALSQAVIRDWMCKKVTSSHPNYSDLEGYWRMDEGSGTVAADLSGNGHDGTLTNNPTWQTSEAPIGDESAHDYSNSLSPSLINPGPGGGVMSIGSVTGSPDGMHIYLVTESPNSIAVPNGITSIQTDHYWGVFAANGTNPSFQATYDYTNNNFLDNLSECKGTLVERTHNAIPNWNTASTQNDITLNTLKTTNSSRQEYMIALADTLPLLVVNGSNVICTGDSTLIQITSPIGTGSTYQWFLNGSPISGNNTNSYYASTSGTITAQLTTLGGCIMNYFPEIFTTSPGPVSLDPLTPLCDGEPAFPLGGGLPIGGGYRVNGLATNVFSPAFWGDGMHTVKYTYTDPNTGCIDSALQMIEVFTLPTVTFDLDTGICEDMPTYTLTEGLPAGGIYSGPQVNGNLFDATITGTGTYPIQYKFTNGNGCSDSASGNIAVHPLPIAPLITLQNNNSLKSSLPNGNQWYDINGAITGETSQFFIPLSDGEYRVEYTDGNGCSALSEPFEYTVYGIDDPNGLGALSIYPNPANNQVIISFNRQPEEIKMIDKLGREVLKVKPSHLVSSIDISELPAGIYLIQIQIDHQEVVRKLVLEP